MKNPKEYLSNALMSRAKRMKRLDSQTDHWGIPALHEACNDAVIAILNVKAIIDALPDGFKPPRRIGGHAVAQMVPGAFVQVRAKKLNQYSDVFTPTELARMLVIAVYARKVRVQMGTSEIVLPRQHVAMVSDD